MNINNTVKIFLLVILSGCFSTFIESCTKQLEEKPTDFVGPDNFYKTQAQIESALNSSMNRLFGGWKIFDYYRGGSVYDMEDAATGGNLSVGDNYGAANWAYHYRAIADLNPSIKALLADVLGANASQEVKNQLLAQLKLCRGWNYFILARLYGDVPLILENTDPINDKIARAPLTDVYASIISDLLYATQNLPASWPDANRGRPTMDVAKTILAKVYITMATAPLNDNTYYLKARDMAKEVIDAGNYYLTPNVADVFKLENSYGPEMMWSFHNSEQEYVTEPQVWLPGPMADGWGDCRCEKVWSDKYPEEPRKHAYLLLDDEWFGSGTTYMDWGGMAYIKKYLYDSPQNFLRYVSYENVPIVRFADALLLFAEAENMVNGSPTQAACDAVNQIVNRATGGVPNAADPLFTITMARDDFDSAVIEQRNLELCFEYDRWFDIQRKRILEKVSNPAYLPNYNESDYLLPIPLRDLKLNPLLTQNPGYSGSN